MSRSRLMLLLLAGSFLLAGIVEPFSATAGEPMSGAGFVHSFVIAILCFTWCKADAAARGVTARGGAVFAALLPPIGLPFYFFRTRPAMQAFLSCAKALLFFLFCVGLFVLGLYAVEKSSGLR